MSAPEAIQCLSHRQREILVGFASSETTKSIALQLRVSPKTVEYHRAQIYQRLHINDIAGITRFAIRAGAIQP